MKEIAKHLDRSKLKYPIHQIATQCCFTGESIEEGIKITDLVSDVFTDYEFVKYPSGYAGIDAALCIGDVIPGKTRNNALRNYSYYADNEKLLFLGRNEILELLLNVPAVPFRVVVSFNNKKHTSYKTVLNTDKDLFVVTTDLFSVVFDRKKVDSFLKIIQKWYSIIPEKANTSAQPTYFTKEEILHGNAGYHKQVMYGLYEYEAENDFLKQVRDTHLFVLVVHLLNKSSC